MGITREQVIKQFLKYVECAEKALYIRKPFSWAAYQTWKWVNTKEKDRNEVEDGNDTN